MDDNKSSIAVAGTLSVIVVAVLMITAPALSARTANNGPVQEDPSRSPQLDIVGEGWFSFAWWGSTLYGGPWTFDADQPITLRVTDAHCYGEQFAAFDNGEELGETSEPGRRGCPGPTDPDEAYKDEDMSSGCWLLLPGSHSIEVEVRQNPYIIGLGYLRADTLVDYMGPECLPIPGLP